MVSRQEDESSAGDAVSQFSSTPPVASVPTWCPGLLGAVVDQVASGRGRSRAVANHEPVQTRWNIGQELLAREASEGRCSKVVTRLSADLRDRLPEARGFCPRNLRYMKSFAAAWPEPAMLRTPSATLSWSHHVLLLDKVSEEETRRWYLKAAAANGWPHRELAHQIATRLHERAGKARSNFQAALPPSSPELVQEATSDPYIFDFLAMSEKRSERELESQLMQHVECFLLQLGQGFAFVGRQMCLDIAGDEFFPDLLFYNFKLRRFVVVELKATKHEPGYLGQPGDEPTIGLLLCKTKNAVVAKYARRGYKSPIGVAVWATGLGESLPAELAGGLPTIDELEAELSQHDTED